MLDIFAPLEKQTRKGSGKKVSKNKETDENVEGPLDDIDCTCVKKERGKPLTGVVNCGDVIYQAIENYTIPTKKE